jgi:hypothetical protein
LNITKNLSDENGNYERIMKSIYGVFIFAPFAMLVFSWAAFFYREKNFERSFHSSVSALVFLLILIIIVLTL